MAEKSVDDWLTDIDNALEFRRTYAREDKWDSLTRSYLNDPESDTAIGPNLIYTMGDSLMASLNVPDPEFSATATHPMGVTRAPIVENVDNWFVKVLKMKRHADMATLHAYLYGKGIIKIGYDSEFGWAPEFDIGMDGPSGATFTQFDNKGRRIESKNTTPGMPWVSVVHPKDFVVPWGTVFLDDAPWCAHRIIRRTDYFKSDRKYKNTARLEPQLSMEDYMNTYAKKGKSRQVYIKNDSYYANKKAEYTEAWEIHDRMTGKIRVVSRDYDKFMRNGPDALQIAGLPFVDMGFVTHPYSFWATPQAYYLGQIQHTQFDISLQGEKQRRLNNFKLLMKKGAMSMAEATKMLSGDAGAIGIVESSESLRDVFMPMPQGSLIDFAIMSDHNRGNAREAIGYSRNQMGEFDSSSRRTAREATYVNQGSERRTGRRFGAISNLYIDTITKVNQISFAFWKMPKYMMVGNEWVRFSGEELKGDYLYDVTLSTRRNLSRAERKVEAMMMMAQLSALPGIDYPAMLQYLQDAVNDPAFEKILVPVTGGGQTQTSAGALPTIPSTQSEG